MSTRYTALLTGLVFSALSVSPTFAGNGDGCDQIDWKEQILVNFAGIEQACQEIVVRNGHKYVRFEVEFVHASTRGDVDVLLSMRDGRTVARTFSAPASFEASSSSGKSSFHMRDLSRGDMLDVYIPISRVVATAHVE